MKSTVNDRLSLFTKKKGFWGDPRVAVASIINPKMLRGRLFLNATSGTHVFFDKATDAGAIRFYDTCWFPKTLGTPMFLHC